jgi:hypothetical protein
MTRDHFPQVFEPAGLLQLVAGSWFHDKRDLEVRGNGDTHTYSRTRDKM